MNTREHIQSISDIGLCLQTMIRNRYKKKTKPIYTHGRYKSLYITFYRSPHVFQFYVEDRMNSYMVYLLKNEKIVRKDIVQKNESIERFYTRMSHFFHIVN